ncbi:unnamed protein product [Cuscuta europaea]|uniref:At1g68980-like TPR repeats domain-containing protein n=2 Tax=Cuscuta europaea TaxID=41803 RepID=A0A9P1ELM3_CUSEU|nr:unnamed protein product [Cuscuta europaea]
MNPTLRKYLSHLTLIRCYSSVLRATPSTSSSSALKVSSNRSYVLTYMASRLCFSYEYSKHSQTHCFGNLATDIKPEKLCWQGSSHDVLLTNLKVALMHHNIDEAWDTYKDFKRLYGFPDHSLVTRLVTELAYSSDSYWLKKACNLVISIRKDNFGLLRPDLLTKLSLSLARAQMPIRASTVLRLILLKKRLPPSHILQMIFLHLVKTENGMILASNTLIEICDVFQQSTINKSTTYGKFCTKPDTMIFNLVLDACVRFGSSIKGQCIIELMAQVAVTADVQTIRCISLIHEMNGTRDELMKFKEHIDRFPLGNLMCHYRQFYESLLSLHFKFDDIDSASELILDMYVSGHAPYDRKEPVKPCLIPLGGSHHLKKGLTLRVVPYLLQKDTILDNMGPNHRFVTCNKEGGVLLTKKALAKLMLQYKKCGRITDFSKLLCRINKALPPSSTRNILDDVVDACVCLGWLETAHDILDDLDLEGNRLAKSSYMSLLSAYHHLKMFREAELVLKLLHKADDRGICDLQKQTCSGKSDVNNLIARDMREQEKEAITSPVVYKFNSSIYFFMKAQMLGDAKTAYRKMKNMKIQPNVATYVNLIHGYSSVGMYREITYLWGDIRRSIENGVALKNCGLYEMLLLSFLRGGYFERVMEVIDLMKESNMYLDKWMFKYEFLKYHRGLYHRMKVFDAKNEVQKKRIEYVKEFKKWAGLDC